MKSVFAAAAVVLGLSSTTTAAGMEGVSWSNSVEEAWHTAGSLDRPMIVFVTRAGCLPCARMKTITLVHRDVAGLIDKHYVAVALDGSQPTPLLRDLQVHAVPATFIISPKAVILDRIEGFVSPQALASKLTKGLSQNHQGPAHPAVPGEQNAPQWKPATPQPSATARAF